MLYDIVVFARDWVMGTGLGHGKEYNTKKSDRANEKKGGRKQANREPAWLVMNGLFKSKYIYREPYDSVQKYT